MNTDFSGLGSTPGTRNRSCSLVRVRPGGSPRNDQKKFLSLHLLDHFHLGAVGSFHPTDVAAIVEKLLDDLGAVLLESRQRRGIIVGLQGDVLDTELLLVLLAVDDRRD